MSAPICEHIEAPILSDQTTVTLSDRAVELYRKLASGPMGMHHEWSVRADSGKPLLYGRHSLLAYGTIGTWDEFELICALVNSLTGIVPAAHSDDLAVDRLAGFMKRKLARKREQGRSGWEDKAECSNEHLSQLLREHVDKGDALDVINLAMMIHQRDERIAPPHARHLSPDQAWQELCETPDITSPEEYPDHALITMEQLADFMRRAVANEDDLKCPVCLVALEPDDICATDLELGMCHAECLQGSPVVNLDTGEPIPGGEMDTYRFGDTDPGAPAPKYLNLVDGKIYDLVSQDGDGVTFKREGRETLRYLGRSEFNRRFQLQNPAPSLHAVVE